MFDIRLLNTKLILVRKEAPCDAHPISYFVDPDLPVELPFHTSDAAVVIEDHLGRDAICK